MEGEQIAEQRREETVIAPSRKAENSTACKAVSKDVQVLGTLPGRARKTACPSPGLDAEAEEGDIIAVRQGNVFGTSFHPELTSDVRIHVWWLMQLIEGTKEFEKTVTLR